MKAFLVVFTVLGLFFGCSDATNQSVPTSAVDKDFELVSHLTNNMMAPHVNSMARETETLRSMINSSCTVQPLPVEDLRTAWKKIISQFHYTEVFLYGPLLIEEEDKKSETNPIKVVLYSLQDPSNQAAVIDREIDKAKLQGADKYKIRKRPNIMGLDAIEYVLFGRLSEQAELVAGEGDCVYLNAVTSELSVWMQKVRNDFFKKVYQPLQTSEGQANAKAFLNLYTQSLILFADQDLKDRKLAAPLGLEADDGLPCELGVDCHTLYLGHSFSSLAQESTFTNLLAIQDAFQGTSTFGTPGFGYLTYIEDTDSPVAKSFIQGDFKKRWQEMPVGEDYIQTFASYKGDQSLDNLAYAAYVEVKKLSDWLKSSFLAEMNAELPDNVQGDND